MKTLSDWVARRSGGHMTIQGNDRQGHPQKLAGVDRIEAGKPHPIAIDTNGERFALL